MKMPVRRNDNLRKELDQLLERRRAEVSPSAREGVPATQPGSPDLLSRPLAVKSSVANVVVTYNEVNTRHGTGVLLGKIFSDAGDIVSIRSVNTYGGDHAWGAASLCLPRTGLSRRDVYALMIGWFGECKVRRVLCVPYGRDDAVVALAVSELFGAPLATWIMDDQNVGTQGIPDDLMEELLVKSRLRLAISPEMRVAYEAKYRLKFWLLPPVVSSDVLWTSPSLAPPADARRGILVGNIWGQRWLDLLRQSVREAGITVDWYCNSGRSPGWLTFDPEALARDGITLHDPLPEPQLAEVLRTYAFAIVPSGTLDAFDDNHAVARLSLPTRVPFVVAASTTPIIVLGDSRTAVSRFVTRHGLGTVAGYTGDQLTHAVAFVTDSERQAAMRRNASSMAEGFKAEGIAQWIWTSLETECAADSRFEQLLPADASDLSYYVERPVPSNICRDFHGIFHTMRRLKERGFYPEFVLDVGASTGVWSHAVAEVFPGSRFLLVDPLWSRHDKNSRGHYSAGRQNFEAVEAAVADKPGRFTLHVTDDLYRSSLLELAPGQRRDTVDVEVVTVDQLTRERGLTGPGLLKVDVQHAEHLVIEGARDSLSRSIVVVVLELTLTGAPEGAKTFLEMLNLMQDLGFRVLRRRWQLARTRRRLPAGEGRRFRAGGGLVKSSWSVRILRGFPLVKRFDTLKRQHFKQQDSIGSRVRAIEQAARSSLDSEASLLQACHYVIETLGDLRQGICQLGEQVAHLPDTLEADQQASRQLALLEEMRSLVSASHEESLVRGAGLNRELHKVLMGVEELKAQRESFRAQVGAVSQQMQKLLAGVEALIAVREESRAQASGLNQEMQKVLAGVGELLAWREERRAQGDRQNQEVQRLLAGVAETSRVQGDLLAQTSQIREAIGKLHAGDVRRVTVSDYGLANPEVGLMQHLYAFLPNRVAVDVGAHVGEIARRLLDAGYEVYAFEPCLPVFRKLCESLGTVPGFRAASLAIGPEDGERQLKLVADRTVDGVFGDVTQFSSLVRRDTPDGLEFTEEVPVRMRSLDSLWREGEIPRDVGLVKIDTEGFDLEVMRGMGEHRAPLVVAEFWDVEAALGAGMTSNRLHDLVGEMRRRGYHWHIVMYRVDGSSDVSYFVNRAVSVPRSWGNVLFFQQHGLFAEAVRWSAAMLPATHFTA